VSDLSDKKITKNEINAVNVKSVQGSRLHGTVAENKNVFDRLAEFIAGRINDILDVLTLEGAANISLEEIEGLVATTVQDAIAEVFADLEAHIEDYNNPHKVTAEQVREDMYGNVQNAVNGLFQKITAEEQARISGDGLLKKALEIETGARTEEDAKLHGELAAEESERKAHDKTYAGDIAGLRADLDAFMGMFSARTWGDVLNDFPTWQDVLNAGTWLKVYLKGV
jgi:hypothetical protein